MHLNLILTYWSVLCRTATVERMELQLGIVTYHVLTGNRTSINVKFNAMEIPYFCVGDGVLITTEYP